MLICSFTLTHHCTYVTYILRQYAPLLLYRSILIHWWLLCSFTLTTKCGACCFFSPPMQCLHPTHLHINHTPLSIYQTNRPSHIQPTLKRVMNLYFSRVHQGFNGLLQSSYQQIVRWQLYLNFLDLPFVHLFLYSRLLTDTAILMHCLPSPLSPPSPSSSHIADHKVSSLLFLLPHPPPHLPDHHQSLATITPRPLPRFIC